MPTPATVAPVGDRVGTQTANPLPVHPVLRESRPVTVAVPQLPAPPLLTSAGLRLRLHHQGDVDGVLEQCDDVLTRRWTSVPVPYTRQHAAEFVLDRVPRGWREGDFLALAVEVDGRFAGTVDLRPDGAGAADIGFGLAAWARGRGVMASALRLLLPWAVETLALEVVHWQGAVGNWPSRRVAWALGFRLEGTVRSYGHQRGGRHDVWLASLTKAELADLTPRHRWLELPELTGERVLLRRHRPEDAARVTQACAHASTQHWLPDLPSPYTLVDAIGYLTSREEEHASGRGLYWCVADPDDDRQLAEVGLMRLHGDPPRKAEIGYWTHPEERGRGVMTEAVRLVARHALLPTDVGGLGLERVSLRAASGNVGSRRVAEGAGFTASGVERRGERLRDASLDDFVVYDLLADELADEVLPVDGVLPVDEVPAP